MARRRRSAVAVRVAGSYPHATFALACAVLAAACSRELPPPEKGSPRTSGQQPGSKEPPDASTCAHGADLSFVPDPGNAAEAYVCYGFDAVAGRTIGAVHWRVAAGAVTVHHALLYAVTADFPDGPVRCDGMPEGSVGLHVFSPGGDDLVLPSDTGLRLPDGTQRLVVEVHAVRSGAGAVGQSEVTVCSGPDAPIHLAAVMPAVAPVPAIRPHQEEHSTSSCVLGADVHLWSAWPHMHLAGKEISGELVHGASTTTLVEVSDWDFHRQKTYPLMVDAVAGDAIRVSCTWDNATPNYILPGPLTTDEMCNLAFIAWPAAAATCH